MADAASIISHTIEQRVELSSGVFAGLLSEIEMVEENDLPVTILQFSSVRWAYGGVGDRYEVRYVGGTIGETTIRTSGMPSFEEGYRYVLMMDSINDAYVPLTAGEYGAFQVVSTIHGDELLVNSPGQVLLLSGTGKVRPVHWFGQASRASDISISAPDFKHPLSEADFLGFAAEWSGNQVTTGPDVGSGQADPE